MNDQEVPAGPTMNRREWLAASGVCIAAGYAGTVPLALRAASGGAATSAAEDVERLLRLASVPGMAIATVSGREVSVEGFGVRRAGASERVSGDTVFEAASLSKPVFATIVLQLAAEGAIDLARPLAEYLALPNPADERARSITATHVLSHSSGWRNWRNGRDTTLTADFPPGSRFSYSGEGFFFLQRVVETLTGRGLPRLARERVFEPLGMRNSAFIWRPTLDGLLASPHSNRGEPFDSHHIRIARAFHALAPVADKPVDDWSAAEAERGLPRADPNLPVLPNFLVPNAASSLLTSARDYGTFVRWLMAGGRPVLDRMTARRIAINEALGWGLGVGLEEMDGRHYAWHWGDNPGFKNFVVAEPRAGQALVLLTNGNAGQRVYERAIRARTGNDHPAFLWF